jgi:pimeloyl-ACP methyl ester carboxylesterase
LFDAEPAGIASRLFLIKFTGKFLLGYLVVNCNSGQMKTIVLFLILLWPAISLSGKPFPNSHFVWVDDVAMHYRLWEGEGRGAQGSVLLVHGFAGSTFSWEGVADSLHQLGYHVVAVDVPPFGYSDKSPRINQSVTARAALLNALLEQEFPGRSWHLAGHSMGGAIVQAMALMYPERTESLTLVAATMFWNISPGERASPAVLRLPGLTGFAGGLAEAFVINRRRVANLLESAYGMEPTREQVNGYLRPLQIPGTARAILNSTKHYEEQYFLDSDSLMVPGIAIWGDQDTWVPLEGHQSVLDNLPTIRLVVMEDVGHNPMETHFYAFMEIWLDFLGNFYP